MSINVRSALNRVLRTIGEAEIAGSVTTLTDTYQLQILTFLNQIKEEVEDAHNWRSLHQTVTVTIAGGASSAAVSGANERSRLIRIQDSREGREIPLVFDVTDPANPIPLHEVDHARMIYMDTIDTQTAVAPCAFVLDNGTAGNLRLRVYPTPAAARTIQVSLIIPQARLEAADMATVLQVPVTPVEMGTTWYALMERGEQQGVSGIFTEDRFRTALDNAISRDAAEQGGYELTSA
jgi:hypothetical protein